MFTTTVACWEVIGVTETTLTPVPAKLAEVPAAKEVYIPDTVSKRLVWPRRPVAGVREVRMGSPPQHLERAAQRDHLSLRSDRNIARADHRCGIDIQQHVQRGCVGRGNRTDGNARPKGHRGGVGEVSE